MHSFTQAEHALCKICQVEPCLAMPLEHDYRLSASPSEPDDDTPSSPRANAAIGQLLSDMGGLVGSALLSDVVVRTRSGSSIPAHAVILAARCPKLRKVCNKDGKSWLILSLSLFLFLSHTHTHTHTHSPTCSLSLSLSLICR